MDNSSSLSYFFLSLIICDVMIGWGEVNGRLGLIVDQLLAFCILSNPINIAKVLKR